MLRYIQYGFVTLKFYANISQRVHSKIYKSIKKMDTDGLTSILFLEKKLIISNTKNTTLQN